MHNDLQTAQSHYACEGRPGTTLLTPGTFGGQVFGGAAGAPARCAIKDERNHQVQMTNHVILLSEASAAFPQEWPPVLENVHETAPRSPAGLSAFDVSMGCALLTDVDKRLVLFRAPAGLAETDLARALFRRCIECSKARWVKRRSVLEMGSTGSDP